MTEALYHQDAYLKEFQAVVLEVVGAGVVLDKSAFYPGGGGQPSDVGILRVGDAEYRVLRLNRKEDKIIHELDQAPPALGATVTGIIDWERRYRLMKTHTALHILCGVVWRDYGSLVTGGNMQPLQARMDFEMEHMSADFAEEMEEKVNKEVTDARPVVTALLPRDEAMRNPDLIRTKINLLPPEIQEIRVVDIQGLDIQADGGTHVANTQEVGHIRIVGHESKGRINKRLRIQVEK
ncbi:MAG: alanyl-tRNA editing protein [Dehalococcoidia bacterium]